MPAPLSGPGVGLPPNQQLYPTQLGNSPADFSSNRIALAGGQMIVLPSGDWYVSLGMYCVLQFFDQVTNSWVIGASGGWECGLMFVKSDGFNVRVANLTGCPVGAVVSSPTTQGGWVQASTSIAVVGGGGSLWQPIVGGALAVAGTLVTAQAGVGYGVAPMLFIPPPPGPANNSNGVGGIPAHAIAFISSGTVSSISLINQGAGYPVGTYTLAAIPQPFDPNLATGITAATLTYSVVGSGSITAVICTNNGAPLAAFNPGLTLTASGAGTNSTLVPVIMQSVVSASINGAGNGLGTAPMITTMGGNPSLGSLGSTPEFQLKAFKPRPAQISVAITATGSVTTAQPGVVIDGGLFEGVPTPLIVVGNGAGGPAAGGGSILGPTIVLTMGTNPDFVHIQAAP